jgi:tetratricopeptide (TPR) repeat protein
MQRVLAGLILLLFTTLLEAAPDQSISGTLLSDNGEVACDHCLISLLANGVRPIATSYLDLGGHFSFRGVPQGTYTIHAEIEGFEDVNQVVEARDNLGLESNVTITVTRKRLKTASGGDAIVNVSEFLDLYPKKAVEAFKKGLDCRREKKNEQAIKSFETATRIAPTFYHAHNELGIAYREAGRTDDAEREFLQAHELNSTNIEPLLNLTTLYLDENKPDRAVNTSEEAVKTNGRSAPAFFNLGIALYKAAMLDRAEVALKKALELAPKMAAVRLMLANVYLKLRRYDNVLEQLNSYIAENPHGEQLQAASHMREELLRAQQTQKP